jgi:hypothetical protein
VLQLTILTLDIFRRINFREFIGQPWAKNKSGTPLLRLAAV